MTMRLTPGGPLGPGGRLLPKPPPPSDQWPPPPLWHERQDDGTKWK
jgi:hypothetical protein